MLLSLNIFCKFTLIDGQSVQVELRGRNLQRNVGVPSVGVERHVVQSAHLGQVLTRVSAITPSHVRIFIQLVSESSHQR